MTSEVRRTGPGSKARSWLVGSVALLVVAAACGSDDETRRVPPAGDAGQAGVGGQAGASTDGGQASEADAGAAAETMGGAGATSAVAGAPFGGQSSGGAGWSGSDAGGAGGAGGESLGGASACEGVDPISLQGRWLTDCNGYTTVTNIAASGELATSSTNGQYSVGTLDDDGVILTEGEGGPYVAFSTEGTLARTGCETVHYDYVGQIPRVTGPKTNYSCDSTRQAECAPTLLEALVGTWSSTCGNSTCVTTFTLDGVMSSTCSNGQASEGTVDAVGAFETEGGGGNFADYSTTGVVGLQTCDTLLMPYTWQSPPQQGTKHSLQCTYTRQE